MSLTQALKIEARRLGFDLVGITTPDPPAHFPVYERWLADGRHGEMGYLATDRARARRGDPSAILPDCRSILVLGAAYPAGIPSTIAGRVKPGRSASDIPTGKIAAYARGSDYHDLFAPRLRALVTFLEDRAGKPVLNRWYTDTGPLLERDLAQRAGLGWIGKNTCLIAPGLGSYFLLAEILLGFDLDPDPPFVSDRCGTCTQCIEACPTGCILPDRTIDARRCISYLTIELKGAIPPTLRPLMGEWVFGCDVCQQVCPWNRFVPSPPEDPLIDLMAALSLTSVEFNREASGTPLSRTRRRGYLRNVAVVLGNARNVMAVPALEQVLSCDPEPLVRGHAAWALGQIGGINAQEILLVSIQVEADEFVRAEIQAALQNIKTG
jgi:epoxyqueuosine reductase